ncbi:MAG: TIGR04282 family arsenosugar biosynthesis glycosyltransferase [Flavobacteriaceae bacterium]
MTNKEDLLLIFTRNPELGKCKTRLAATIGDPAALEVYRFLLQHTVNITQRLKVSKTVYYSEAIWENDIWPKRTYAKALQKGSDLGERMAQAFRDGFKAGYKRIIIIGSDMYDLSPEDLEKAFDCLKTNDFVLGPANDGGYYLMGMKAFKPALFKDKSWGMSSVLSSSLNDLKDEKVALLEPRNDIDVYEDIKDNAAFATFLKHMTNDETTT